MNRKIHTTIYRAIKMSAAYPTRRTHSSAFSEGSIPSPHSLLFAESPSRPPAVQGRPRSRRGSELLNPVIPPARNEAGARVIHGNAQRHLELPVAAAPLAQAPDRVP